ncbi:T9SS type A sorting domain-containing protein [candidate division KSB1 bacterium]|nr:T9SS type A sorting domain-containing protein [candidate division KSB1 bacterium]
MRTIAACLILLLSVSATITRADLTFDYLHVYGIPEGTSSYWRTSYEQGVDYFELWRTRADSEEYVLVVTTPSRGDDPDGTMYHYYDEPLGRGIEYHYYISAYDLDGSGGVVSDTVSERTAPVEFTVFDYSPACPSGYWIQFVVDYEVDVQEYVLTGGFWAGCQDLIAVVPAIGQSDSAVTYDYFDSTLDTYAQGYCLAARCTDGSLYDPGWAFIPEPPESRTSLDDFGIEPQGPRALVTWSAQHEWWLRCYELRRKPVDSSEFEQIAQVSPANSWEPVTYSSIDSTVAPDQWYDYRLGYVDDAYQFHALRDTTFQFIDAVSGAPPMAEKYKLLAYPNPFNPSTNISLTIPRTARTCVVVYDFMGREVRTLHDGVLERGEYEFAFAGTALPSGLYFARVTSGAFVATRKLLLLK